MSRKLVIVESPAKARTINKILGRSYTVKASMGHVRDLPERSLGVDIARDFEPKYVIIRGRKKVVQELKKAARNAEAVYLAPDPDREGEAIAWHLQSLLEDVVPSGRFYRVTYNEITPPAIHAAFKHPGRIDLRKVNSQQARRILDRLVGYRVSPLLWRRIRGAASAGRVQSVALRLVCEREKAIRDFVPQEYWVLGAKVSKRVEPKDPFEVRLVRINGEKPQIPNAAAAEQVRCDLEGRTLRVSELSAREMRRRPPPPFITSSMQQAASAAFGFSPAYTMRLAQRLYEGEDFGEGPVGLITYMRTDSFHVSPGARDACREYIRQTFGPEFVPEKPNVFRSRKGAQEAHEAIRPTDVLRTPDSLKSVLEEDELKLYGLIWERFVASQMQAARLLQRAATIEAVPKPGQTTTYEFRATATEVVFPGYLKLATWDRPSEPTEEEPEVAALPPLAEGEELDLIEWLMAQKFTQPPPRYTDATLVRALEENGVGRPSTYAQILSTLVERRYVVRRKRTLIPTEMGMQVCDFLVAHLPELFDVQFTARMEESLDEIEEGRVDWTEMLRDFNERLQSWLEAARGPDADPEAANALVKLLEGVQEWKPARRGRRRAFDDRQFVESVREQLRAGKRISERQLKALMEVALRYRDQLPELPAVLSRLGYHEEAKESTQPAPAPCPLTLRKLELLENVTFRPPRKVGKRTFDDAKFVASLRSQVAAGRPLSASQVHYLDRMLLRYAEQIPNFEAVRAELGLEAAPAGAGEDLAPLLEALRSVREWKPPVRRKARTWDDRQFFESLAAQYAERKHLSFKQQKALKRLVIAYRSQIPDYAALAARFNLPTDTSDDANPSNDSP